MRSTVRCCQILFPDYISTGYHSTRQYSWLEVEYVTFAGKNPSLISAERDSRISYDENGICDVVLINTVFVVTTFSSL